MPKIIFTDEVNRNLDNKGSTLERIQTEVALLLGEVQWRRVAVGDAELIRKESEEMTPEDIDEMLAFYQAIVDGREPPRVSEIKWTDDEQKELGVDLSGATEDEHRARLLYHEIEALLTTTEELTVDLHAEKVASARQLGPETTESLMEVLDKFRLGGIEDDNIKLLEEAIFDSSGPNRAMLVTDSTRQVLAASVTPDWIANAPESGDGGVLAVIDLDEDITHRIDGPTFEELTGTRFSTTCEVELQDIGDSPEGRVMQLTMFAAAKGKLAACGECMPEHSGKRMKLEPPS